MPNQSGLEAAIQELELQQRKLQEAIAKLRTLRGGTPTSTPSGGPRRMSAAARRKIAEAQRKRWAARRASANAPQSNSSAMKPAARKPLSPAARQRIAAAQKKRWAAVKARKKVA
jgi:hypothetical protein